MVQNAEAGSSNAGHRIRISSGGNIQKYVKFALTHLDEHPHKSLIIHTIPPSSSSDPQTISPSPSTTLHPATLTIPKLISVVEIIKREYISSLISTGRGSGQHKSKGLWQYNEVGNLPVDSTGVGEGNSLENVLNGKTRPKMLHRPYMQITLSTKPLGLERETGITCQYVLAKRRRKGAKKDADEDDFEEGVQRKKTVVDLPREGQIQGKDVVTPGPSQAPIIDGTEKKRKPLSSQESRPVKRKKGSSSK